jgi:hypothetical protein
MDLTPTHKLEQFGGIDNVHLPTARQAATQTGMITFLNRAEGVDLGNRRNLERRDGYRTVRTISGQWVHSLWSNGDNIALVMSDDKMLRLNVDLTTTILMTGFALRRMSFVQAGLNIYFTNGVEIGCYDDNGVRALATPTDPFKAALKPGHIIEYYNHTLYTAVNNVLYCSDPVFIEQYDIRRGLIPFPSRITMVKAVEDGLWVSDLSRVYFLQGTNMYDFQTIRKSSYPALENSAVATDSVYLNGDNPAQCVIFSTTQGVCVGFSGGSFVNQTIDRYHIPESFIANAAFVRTQKDKYQYLLMGMDVASGETMDIVTRLPLADTTMVHNRAWDLPTFIVEITGTTA